MGEKFYLHFLSDNYGKKSINEPIDYDKCDFNLNQEDKRYARDISFSGGDFMLNFVKWRDHELEKLLYYHSTFGFEAKVNVIIEFSKENEIVIGQLDFQTAKTDGLTYFKCKIIQDSKQALIKRREDIKVNLLSDKTLDDEDIEPLVPENVFIKAKPLIKTSRWKSNDQQAGATSITKPRQSNIGLNLTNTLNLGANNCNIVESYEIDNSLSFISNRYALVNGFPNDGLNFTYLEFATDQKDVTFEFSEILAYSFQTYTNTLSTDVLSGSGSVQFVVKIGFDEFDTNMQTYVLYERTFGFVNSTPIEYLPTELTLNIPFIERNKRVWIYLKPDSQATFSTNNIATLSNYTVNAIMDRMTTKITSTSVDYSTISPTFRLYDVMKYVAKSIADIDIDAPRFQSGGYFYNQRILNGNFLRNIKDRDFTITLKELREYLPEINGDYEVNYYSKLFFGLFEDYYKNEEIAFFSSSQFDSLEKSFNPRFSVNEFNYKYKSYLSQKENSTDNTYDSVHGESQWFLKNIMVENKKEVEVEFYRDAFLLEDNRRKGLKDSITKANQDDDKKAIIDTIELDESERTRIESAYLQHYYDSETGYLTLRTTEGLNFELLGIYEGTQFTLQNTNNAGLHNVVNAYGNTVVLQRVSPGTSSFDGNFITRFQYYVSSEVANYTIWTNEGFTLINNISNGNDYANLRFSKKRNIINYWNSYLATCNLYHKELGIKKTFYKNNPDALTVYEGAQVREGETFVPSNPILSPVLYENVTLLCDKEEFFNIQKDVRTKRGYFRFIDNTGTVIKGYPKNMKYMISESALVCDLEEKYTSANLTIDTSTIGIILINNETRVFKFNYKFLDKKLYIYDDNDELLYNPVYWNKVTINEAFASSEIELKNWLELI